MQLISSRALQRELPHLSEALVAIETSLEKSPEQDFLEVRKLAKEASQIDVTVLVTALNELTKRGIFKRKYRLQMPSGRILPSSFSDPLTIPNEVLDAYENSVNTDNCKVVMVYEGDS